MGQAIGTGHFNVNTYIVGWFGQSPTFNGRVVGDQSLIYVFQYQSGLRDTVLIADGLVVDGAVAGVVIADECSINSSVYYKKGILFGMTFVLSSNCF